MPEKPNVFSSRPRVNADQFVEGGQLREMPPPQLLPEPQAVTLANPASSPRIKQGTGSHSYKHKTVNFMRLRRLAQKMDCNVGDLLDECIEAKLPELEERAGKVDW